MSKKLKRIKKIPLNLSTQFLLALVIAALIGTGAAFASLKILSKVIRHKVENSEYIEQNIQNKISEFQKYVTDNSLSTQDIEQMSKWVKTQQNVMLAISDGENVIYDSTDFRFRGRNDGNKPILPNSYKVKFSDREADAALFVLIEFKVIVMTHYFSTGLGIIVFLVGFIAFIRRKVKYITLLDNEVNILEGGDLNYHLTVKGRDELTYLAKSIDDMRKSIIERQSAEEQARLANRKLVTAMSHDLRTPLTVLIGLIEIIDGKKYKNEEELEMYVDKTKNKAYQIKELSDKIFEYFFAFDIKESELDKKSYGIEVINTLIEDYIFSLSEKGYTVQKDLCLSEGKFSLDIKVFSRVIDNIFSNILKYADKEKNVKIKSSISNGFIKISFSNSITKKTYKEESTHIGLEVCDNIVKQHNGRFECREDENIYTASVSLPLIRL